MADEMAEVFEAVGRINCDLADLAVREEEECYLYLEIMSNWFCTKITFLSYDIWNSEDDEREFNEEKGEYEPLESYLRKKVCEILMALSAIHL